MTGIPSALHTGPVAPKETQPAHADVQALAASARALAGRTISWVADHHGVEVPVHIQRAKGWVGQLIEVALGASAGSKPGPDFPELGVELKTLPVTAAGQTRESTWVCSAPLDGSLDTTWSTSGVWQKLRCVLWVPIVGDRDVPVLERRVGSAFLWSPDRVEEAALRADFEELAEMIALGHIDDLTAHRGEVLQIRPKAAHSRKLQWTLAEDGQWMKANPRGFYLRASFTRALLARHLVVAS